MSYLEAKAKYAAIGIDTDAAIAKLRQVPVSLHCWQGDDVRGFDTDPTKPLTGGIQTTGNYPGRAQTPEQLMLDLDTALGVSHIFPQVCSAAISISACSSDATDVKRRFLGVPQISNTRGPIHSFLSQGKNTPRRMDRQALRGCIKISFIGCLMRA